MLSSMKRKPISDPQLEKKEGIRQGLGRHRKKWGKPTLDTGELMTE